MQNSEVKFDKCNVISIVEFGYQVKCQKFNFDTWILKDGSLISNLSKSLRGGTYWLSISFQSIDFMMSEAEFEDLFNVHQSAADCNFDY